MAIPFSTTSILDLANAIHGEVDPVRQGVLLCEIAKISVEGACLNHITDHDPELRLAMAHLKRAGEGVTSYYENIGQQVRERFPQGIQEAMAHNKLKFTELQNAIEPIMAHLEELKTCQDELSEHEHVYKSAIEDAEKASGSVNKLREMKRVAESHDAVQSAEEATIAAYDAWHVHLIQARESVNRLKTVAETLQINLDANQRVLDALQQTDQLLALPIPVPHSELIDTQALLNRATTSLDDATKSMNETELHLSGLLEWHSSAMSELKVKRGGL